MTSIFLGVGCLLGDPCPHTVTCLMTNQMPSRSHVGKKLIHFQTLSYITKTAALARGETTAIGCLGALETSNGNPISLSLCSLTFSIDQSIINATTIICFCSDFLFFIFSVCTSFSLVLLFFFVESRDFVSKVESRCRFRGLNMCDSNSSLNVLVGFTNKL